MTQSASETWSVRIVVPETSSLDAAGETFDLEVREDETILAAARSAGVWLPADCQQGWCTTCAARLVDGDVAHPNARRYYDEDREAGFVLPCTAKPRADTTLIVGQYDDFLEFRADHGRPPGSSKLDT
ncbi:2Fe-2S iron-sulfur cluster-binding protein [Halorubrum salinum]|uniref:2Fe-2S iron-sulfur cluster-binding protein n=1 Tax=Halorubrum salinum TaxID=767517 RepID=UPI0021135F3C|nr:2Fe-2S iron-sulfur cluster binding domain-containing protein [Halorubrum salinum]